MVNFFGLAFWKSTSKSFLLLLSIELSDWVVSPVCFYAHCHAEKHTSPQHSTNAPPVHRQIRLWSFFLSTATTSSWWIKVYNQKLVGETQNHLVTSKNWLVKSRNWLVKPKTTWLHPKKLTSKTREIMWWHPNWRVELGETQTFCWCKKKQKRQLPPPGGRFVLAQAWESTESFCLWRLNLESWKSNKWYRVHMYIVQVQGIAWLLIVGSFPLLFPDLLELRNTYRLKWPALRVVLRTALSETNLLPSFFGGSKKLHPSCCVEQDELGRSYHKSFRTSSTWIYIVGGTLVKQKHKLVKTCQNWKETSAYVNLHTQTNILDHLATSVGDVQITGELLSDQAFFKCLRDAVSWPNGFPGWRLFTAAGNRCVSSAPYFQSFS